MRKRLMVIGTATTVFALYLAHGAIRVASASTNFVERADVPPARAHHAMTYDPVRQRVVLSGGSTPVNGGQSYRFFNDMWEFDGTTWKALPSSGVEVSGIGLAYDTQRRRLVSFGGLASNTRIGDLRTFDGSAWKTISVNDSMPVAEPGFAYDVARNRFVAFGGSAIRRQAFGATWEYDGAQWTQLQIAGPTARQGHAMTYDESRKVIVVFSGAGTSEGNQPPPLLNDTWEFDGTAWTRRAIDGPSPRTSAGITYDSRRKRVILFGGATSDGFQDDTWAWDGTAWRLLSERGPDARVAGVLAYDARRDKVVMFGGRTGFPDGDRNDTWEFDGDSWKRVASASAESGASTASPATNMATPTQRSALWGSLQPGAYAVGYDIIEVTDSTRIVRRARADHIEDQRSRFRQYSIHLWYPAAAGGSLPRMTYRQYILQQRSGVRAPDSLQQRSALDEDFTFTQASYRSLTRDDWQHFQSTHFEARFGAPWASGRFPAIIGYLRPVSTSVTAEYLASHGFVVAMVKPRGRPNNRVEQALSVEDQERAMPIVRHLAGVSSQPFGAMGFSGAGFAPLLLSMKSADIGAFASIESGYFAPGLYESLTQSPFYDASRLTVPFLYLYSDALAAGDRHFDEFNRLRYSTRYHFLLHNPAHNHWDYGTEGMAIAVLAPQRHPTPALVQRGFALANQHLLAFFKSTLLGDSAARQLLAQSATRVDPVYSLRILPAAPEPMDAELLGSLFRRAPQRALAYLDTLAKRDSSATLLRPDALNRLGYELLRQQQRTSSLAVFAMVTRLAPWSANAFDSYAEALEAASDSTAARQAASRALELAPSDSTLTPAARDNLLQINRERVARLR